MRILLGFLLLLSAPCFAALSSPCPQADAAYSPNFCSSFQAVAICHCMATGLPAGMCQNVNEIYDRMIAIFGSVNQACAYQQDTSLQACVDDWNCYRSGGKDSQGNLCSSTGNHC